MSDRRENAEKLRVGVFVILAILTFLGLIYALGARARLFESRYTVHAEFTEVGGLLEGATVRLAGVQIGRVTAVTLPGQPGGKVRVDLTLARRFAARIRKNSLDKSDSDVTRGGRQQQVMQALKAKLVSPFSFFKLRSIGNEVMKPLATDLSANELLQLGWVQFRASTKLSCNLGGDLIPPVPGVGDVLDPTSAENVRVIAEALGKSAPQPVNRKIHPFAAACSRGG